MKTTTALLLAVALNACAMPNHGPSTWIVTGAKGGVSSNDVKYTAQDVLDELQIGVKDLNTALGCSDAVTMLQGQCDPLSQDCFAFVPDAQLQKDRGGGPKVAGFCSWGAGAVNVGIEETQSAVPYQARLIALHELGHSFGLGHTPGTLMDAHGYQLAEDDKVQWEILLNDLATRILDAGFQCRPAPDAVSK